VASSATFVDAWREPVTARRSGPFAVVVVTKSPRSGHVKTRLCPPLAPVDAALLHAAFLRDTLDRVRLLADVDVAVAYTPAEDRPRFEATCAGVMLLPQSDGDLGTRLAAIFETLCARGFRGIVAIGADTPTLPPSFVRHAFDLLSRAEVDVVLGPAHDGGYYLIGLKEPEPALFRDIAWSTDRVYALTMDRAAEARLRTACLPPWHDVDTFVDLRRLASELATDGTTAPYTRAQLVQLGLL